MRIEWAIPCRYCEVEDNVVTMVGGNAGAFEVPEFPWAIGVWIAIQLVAPAVETGPRVSHRFRARVLDPQMEVIPDTELEIADFFMDEPALEGWESDEVVPTFHRFEAQEAGSYTIELQVDERSKTVPITMLLPEAEDEPIP